MQTGFAIPEEAIREQAKADGITHLSTGVAVVRGGRVLVVRRAADDFLGGSYELPGGGVDEGESLQEAVIREVREEAGLEVTEVLGMFPGFDYVTPSKPHVRQMNFLVRTQNADVELSGEHDAYKWVAFDEVEGLQLTDSMRQCLIDALELADSF